MSPDGHRDSVPAVPAPADGSRASRAHNRIRAGIVITGTEVLTGRVSDRNGPWLADRLEELGVDLAYTTIVGDRRTDMLAALEFMAREGIDVVLTSGGLGPTADDLTAEVVGEFQSREMVLDEALEDRIAEILRPLAKRWPNLDMEALRVGNRKQAVIPRGATVLEPVGTAPGLVVSPRGSEGPPVPTGRPDRPPPDGPTGAPTDQPTGAPAHQPTRGPTVVVLPGPPRELQPMWAAAVQTEALQAVLAGAGEYRRAMLRLFGIPESEIAETLRVAEREGVALGRLEITTCLRRGEVEVVTRYEPDAEGVYEAFADVVRTRHPDTLFSQDGSSVDVQVAALLRGERPRETAGEGRVPTARGAGLLTIAVAESCTGGLLAARLTELPGSSEYVRGGIVAYSNEVKVAQAGVPAELIERHGAVSVEVAQALAEGVRAQLKVDVGVGVTGVAGPGGGTPAKPVGLVCLSVAGPDGASLTRSVTLPGGRADVRDRATTVALHMVRRVLIGDPPTPSSPPPPPDLLSRPAPPGRSA
jgi:nicotinamide-nucleotide amidase